jgi:hypothetical protein
MVAVVNSLAFYATHEHSDIDLFIITAPKRVYLVRALANLFLLVLGKRVTKNKIAGRFCLSFFVATDSLNFEWIALPGGDPYFVSWMMKMKPIIQQDAVYRQLLETNRSWIGEISDEDRSENSRFLLKEAIGSWDQWPIIDPILDIIDDIVAFVSMPLLRRRARRVGPSGTDVIIERSIFKYHHPDRREMYKRSI